VPVQDSDVLIPDSDPGPADPGSLPDVMGVDVELIEDASPDGFPADPIQTDFGPGEPSLLVTPEQVDMGFAAPGIAVSRMITVTNAGTGTLVIEEIGFDGNEDGEFSLAPDPGFAPTNPGGGLAYLGPGQSHPVTVRFTSTGGASGTATTTLRVEAESLEPALVEVTVERTDKIECKLVLVPEKLNFGIVPVGVVKQLVLALTNTGSGPCGFQSARIEDCSAFGGMSINCPTPGTGQPSTLFTFMSLPVPSTNGIAPGEEVNLRVRFSPTSISEMFPDNNDHVALLSVVGYDPETAKNVLVPTGTPSRVGTRYDANITGTAGNVKVSMMPAEVDFGLVETGCHSRARDVCIHNNGTAALRVENIELVGCNSEFSLLDLSVPVDVMWAQPACFKIDYAPIDAEVDECSGHVISDGQVVISFDLRGEGTTVTEQTDQFQQVSGQAVDYLFVIDDSGSMCEEQDRLIANFPVFLQQLDSGAGDYHIGIVSVNVINEAVIGRLNRGMPGKVPRYIVRGPDAQAQFADLADLGCDGNSDAQEAPLQAAQAALSPPLATTTSVGCTSDSDCQNNAALCATPSKCPYYCIANTCGGWNQGFIRDDARLEIVVLTDEEDQSVETVDFYVGLFQGLKGVGNPDMLHVNGIIGVDKTGEGFCQSPDGATTAAVNLRVAAAVDQTGGVVASICDPDYETFLREIGTGRLSLKTQFPLTRLADPESIQVVVDGSTCLGGWDYDGTSNSVVFDEEGPCMPQSGETIEVEYSSLCLP